MTIDQESAIAKYIGCKCEIYSLVTGYTWDTCTFNISVFIDCVSSEISSFRVLLTPFENLTQEDFDRMQKEINETLDSDVKDFITSVKNYDDITSVITVNEGDWMRRHGYYLKDELIEEFVKLKE